MKHPSCEKPDHDNADRVHADRDTTGLAGYDNDVEPSEEQVLDEINRYMVDLLDRTRQRSSPGAAPADDEPEPVADRRSSEQRRAQCDRRESESPPGLVDGKANLLDRAPAELPGPLRTQRPEEGANLIAMREVAKGSAHDAITTHDSKQIANRARGKLSVTFVATCTAVVLFWMDPSHSASTVTSALIATVIAGIWAAQSLRLFRTSRRMVQIKPPENAG